MKRKSDIRNWFSKKKANTNSESSAENNVNAETDEYENLQSSASSLQCEFEPTTVTALEESEIEIPDCWNQEQAKFFQKKYDGLRIKNKKLGCSLCGQLSNLGVEKAKSIHISLEWQNCNIGPSGKDKVVQQASLRKKMNEHFTSTSHLTVINILDEAKKETLIMAVEKVNEKHIVITGKIFNIVYSLAKRNRPMSDMEEEVELHIKNQVDLGSCLHSRFSAIKIVEHISEQIRKKVFSTIIERNSKICIIIDEASTVSSKCVLVIFLKCELKDSSATVFLDLVELDSTIAENIYNALRTTLTQNGFNMQYLKKNLIAFCSDGASTMLGHKSGVAARLINEFPNIIIWHCLNHRLQLVLDDSINDIKEINHFKTFLDKIYTIFHRSNKNQSELKKISEDLNIEIIKIGRVLGPRWAACSLRSANAVWRAYPALYEYFSKNTKFLGMARRLKNIYFLRDLALMIDILEEISLLSNALQARSLNITKADKLIKRTINSFEQLKDNFGVHEKKIDEMIATEVFMSIEFANNEKFKSLPRKKLIEHIIEKMKARLLNESHIKFTQDNHINKTKIVELFNVLDPTTWNIEEIMSPWKSGEEKISQLSEVINFKIDLNDFRDYVDNNIVCNNCPDPETIKTAKNIISTIAISSAEAERAFSLMNVVCSTKRSNLTIKHISSLMIINLLGKPLTTWDPIPYVKTWLRSHRTAVDTRVRDSNSKQFNDNQEAVWKLSD